MVRTHLGKEAKRPQTEDIDADESLDQLLPDRRREASPEAMAIATDDERRLRRSLERINERMLTALSLRYFSHMDYQEIADTMQISLGNVKTLIHRGKAALAVAMRDGQAPAAAFPTAATEVNGRELLCL